MRAHFPSKVLVLAPRGFSPGTPVCPLLNNQHFQVPIRSGILSKTISWASGSEDCVSTPHYKLLYLTPFQVTARAEIAAESPVLYLKCSQNAYLCHVGERFDYLHICTVKPLRKSHKLPDVYKYPRIIRRARVSFNSMAEHHTSVGSSPVREH